MQPTKPIQNSFTSGELSPWLEGRIDVEQYLRGARTLKNFDVRVSGGIRRRPGTRLIGVSAISDADKPSRMVEFAYSRDDAFALEFYEGGIKLFKDGQGTGVSVTTIYGTSDTLPYSANDIPELQFAQSADVMWIVHGNHPVATLSRYSDTDWRYELWDTVYGPYMAQDDGGENISLAVTEVLDRAILVSTTTDFSGSSVDDWVQYEYLGQKVLGIIKEVTSDYQVTIEPLEDRSITLTKEVHSPGMYASWDGTNSVPQYTNPITTGTSKDIAFSATNVVTQETVGNYLRFMDKDGDYYWLEVDGVENIIEQGAYGIRATGEILDVTIPSGTITRKNRTINARLTASESGFFDKNSLNPNSTSRKYRLVLDDQVVHAETYMPTDQVPRTCNTTSGSAVVTCDPTGLTIGHTVFGRGIPDGATISSISAGVSFTMDTDATETNASTTLYIGPNNVTSQTFTATLHRPLPLSSEGADVIHNGVTTFWNKGAWYGGNYPTTVAFHGGRLCFAGTEAEPQTIWMSRSADFSNFATTTDDLQVTDASSINILLDSDTVNQVMWMSSRQILLVGTAGGEWQISGPTPREALTPSNAQAKMQTAYGSEFVKALTLGRAALFLQKGGKKLRQMAYNYQIDQHESLDLTVFSDHILEDGGGAVGMTFQPLPDPRVLLHLADGSVAVMTYEPDQRVYAWSKYELGGSPATDSYPNDAVVVESVVAVRRADKYDLYFAVKRTTLGTVTRSVEYIDPDSTTYLDCNQGSSAYATFITNAATRYMPTWFPYPPNTALSAIGAEVKVVLDGNTVVTGPIVDIDDLDRSPPLTGDVACVDMDGYEDLDITEPRVGFNYESVLASLPIPIVGQKRIVRLDVQLKDSRRFKLGRNADNVEVRPGNVPATQNLDQTYRCDLSAGYDRDATFYIKQDEPYPLSILAITARSSNYD